MQSVFYCFKFLTDFLTNLVKLGVKRLTYKLESGGSEKQMEGEQKKMHTNLLMAAAIEVLIGIKSAIVTVLSVGLNVLFKGTSYQAHGKASCMRET